MEQEEMVDIFMIHRQLGGAVSCSAVFPTNTHTQSTHSALLLLYQVATETG